ncbi:hypothetical protein BME24068_04638 [Burkholderia metallica]|nr:hypothetical protein BME24068_04638 [Burkholderia metallica]
MRDGAWVECKRGTVPVAFLIVATRDPNPVCTSASRTTDAVPRAPRFPLRRGFFAILDPRQHRNACRTQHQPRDQRKQTESDFTHPCSAFNRFVAAGNSRKHRRNAQVIVRCRAAIRLRERRELFTADSRGGRTRIHRRPGRLPRRLVPPRQSRAIAKYGTRFPRRIGFAVSQRQLASLDDGGDVRPRTGANEDGGIDRAGHTRQHEDRANEQKNDRPQAAYCVFHWNRRIQ